MGQNAGSCAGIIPSLAPVQTGEGHPGFFSGFGDPMVFVKEGDRMYVLAIWREENDPSVQPFGGARRLLMSYLSTMHLLPGGPEPSATTPRPS
jgi:hypothetical protein